MFSEYMDTEKGLDSMAKKDGKTEKKVEIFENKVDAKKNDLDKDKELALFNTKKQINKWISDLANDPNDLNPKEKQYTVRSARSEAMESQIGQVTEKKIPGFEKTLSDGREVRVTCSDNSFSLNITKKNEDGKQEFLSIYLRDFNDANAGKIYNGKDEKKNNSMPKMTISGNVKLLDKNLNGGIDEKSVGDSVNLGVGDQYDIVKIVNSIEKNVMRLERENVHGNYHVQMEKKEQELKEIDDFRVFLCELQFNPQKNNEEMLIYLSDPNIENFDINNQNYKEIVIALCRLCSRHNSIVEVMKKLGILENENQYSDPENSKTFTGEESVIEYLSCASDSELSAIIKNKDKLIELSKQI